MRNGTNAPGARGLGFVAATLVAPAVLGALLLASADVAAAGADPLADVRACTTERDDAQRLACFDRAAAALPAATHVAGPSTPSASPPAAAATPPKSAEERFGYRGDVAREEYDRRKAEETALEELEARVTRVAAQASGDFLITLDNGQVWAQIATGRPARVKVDDTVTIRRASLGSFILSASTARGVRVRRVK